MGDEVAIKVIVELQSKPGKRAELKSLLESVVSQYGQGQPVALICTDPLAPEGFYYGID